MIWDRNRGFDALIEIIGTKLRVLAQVVIEVIIISLFSLWLAASIILT